MMKRLSADLVMTMSAASERSSSSPFRYGGRSKHSKTRGGSFDYRANSNERNLFRPIHKAHGRDGNQLNAPALTVYKDNPSLSRFSLSL